MKILVFGAGVLGSLYAARLKDAGNDVTLVARGQRYQDLSEHGIVLEYFGSDKRTATEVRLVKAMPEDEHYDVCLVLVRKTQLEPALEALKVNTKIPAFLFMVNNAEGPQAMIDAVGRERVMLGFASAGGERSGHVVRVMEAPGKGVVIGELDGTKSERLKQLMAAFEAAGLPVETPKNMDAWLRYHVALILPLALGLYMAGSCNYRLALHKPLLKKALRGVFEGIKAVRAHGFPFEPPALGWMRLSPDFMFMRPMFRKLLASELMDIGGTRHALSARDEMKALADELLALARSAGMKTPVLDDLYRYVDPKVPPPVTLCLQREELCPRCSSEGSQI